MKQKLIKLTEGDLHNIIRTSVHKVIKEAFDDDFEQEDDNYGDEVEPDIEPEDLDMGTLTSGFGGFEDDMDGDIYDDDYIQQQMKIGARKGHVNMSPMQDDPKIDEIYDYMKKIDNGEISELTDEEREKLERYANEISAKRKYGDTSKYWGEIAQSIADGTYFQTKKFNDERGFGTEEMDDIVDESIKRTLKNMRLI